jgi:uncharacterized membrane protein
LPQIEDSQPGPASGWLQRGLVIGGIVLAVCGSLIAAYLAFENLQAESGVCTIAQGCAKVQQSSYGKLLGVPVSVPGLGLYLALGTAGVVWLKDLRGWRPLVTFFAFNGALVGFLFSMFLTYIEGFVLDAWCIYCIVSASLMTLLMLTWLTLVLMARRQTLSE